MPAATAMPNWPHCGSAAPEDRRPRAPRAAAVTGANPCPQRLDLPDADLTLYADIGLTQTPALLAQLLASTAWEQHTITLYGSSHPQPRLVAWHGDPGAVYRYSGITHTPRPWTPALAALRDAVASVCNASFNSVLLNYYRDQRDSMGPHADDEPELGPEPVIASLSLGATRRIRFRHRTRRDLPGSSFELCDGSLLVMRGATQRHWQHAVPRQARPCGARLNLTFREVRVQRPDAL